MTRDEQKTARDAVRQERQGAKQRALAALVASCARGEFCQRPIPSRIARELGIPERTLRRWASDPKWRQAMGAAWTHWHKTVWCPIFEAEQAQREAEYEARIASTRPARSQAARDRAQGWKRGTLAPPAGCYVTSGGALRRKRGSRRW